MYNLGIRNYAKRQMSFLFVCHVKEITIQFKGSFYGFVYSGKLQQFF